MSQEQKIMNASRALYARLKTKYGSQKGVIITDSYLLLMKSIQSAGVVSVPFDVLTNASSGQTPTAIEKRLNISDKFVVRDHAICLMKAGTTVAATQAEINIGVPRTYPNPLVFTGGAGVEAANLQSIYNGFCTVIIDSIVYYQALDLRRFYRVPTSQKGVAVSAVAAIGILPEDGWDMLNYAFSPVQPQFELNGMGNNQLSVTVNVSVNLQGTASQNFLCWYLRGFLVQNVNQK